MIKIILDKANERLNTLKEEIEDSLKLVFETRNKINEIGVEPSVEVEQNIETEKDVI